MNVSLTPEIEQFIADQVDSGRYRSASEVVRAGMRLLEDQIREREARLELLRRAVDQGINELDQNKALPGEDVFSDLLDELNTDEASK